MAEEKAKINFTQDNTVYIHGEFDDSIVSILPTIKSIIETQKTLKNGMITFSINSNGGYNYILHSLLNLIEYAKKEDVIVKTVVEYRAESCGSLLACSGSTGHRYMSEYAEHLCHFPRGFTYSATPLQVERNAEFYKRGMASVKDMYKKYCEPTAEDGYIEQLFEAMKDDNFYIPAKECIKYGLADQIL